MHNLQSVMHNARQHKTHPPMAIREAQAFLDYMWQTQHEMCLDSVHEWATILDALLMYVLTGVQYLHY